MSFTSYHVYPDSLQNQADFLRSAISLMARSTHLAASEVLRVGRVNAVLPVIVDAFQEFIGKGVGGFLRLPEEKGIRAVVFGSREFMEETGLAIPEFLLHESAKNEGLSFWGGWDGSVRGVLHFSTSS